MPKQDSLITSFSTKNPGICEPRIADRTCVATIVECVSFISFQARCGACDRPAGQVDPWPPASEVGCLGARQDQSGG
jgi:hypothetical protein